MIVGVDDETVDRYNAKLISMSAAIGERGGGSGQVAFMSLVDMFDLAHMTAETSRSLNLAELPSHIATQRTQAAELSRQMLMQACRSDDAVLRARIASADHGTLRLYRGFSRFMAEDLRLSPFTRHLSRCKLKRLAADVSFEMMQRNDAYSNLVELVFPHHVRLSIHAHDNAGPKFGIRLFGPGVAEVRSVDLLHVPTPWHNCLVEVAGRPALVMTKARVVKEAMAAGDFSGRWVGDDEGRCGEDGGGGLAGHFRLERLLGKCEIRAGFQGERWDHQDTLDCCDAGNPYLLGYEASVGPDLRYLQASIAGIGLF
jgi:pyoverdine/dityrosine biosynthesis protein Dit1